MEIKLNGDMKDLTALVEILVKQGYKVTVQRIMQIPPYQTKLVEVNMIHGKISKMIG